MIDKKGVYNTMIVSNRQWSGIMGLSIFSLGKLFRTGSKIITFDIRVHKEEQKHHLFKIKRKGENIVSVFIDRYSKDIALSSSKYVEDNPTNQWAVQNAIKEILNKIYK